MGSPTFQTPGEDSGLGSWVAGGELVLDAGDSVTEESAFFSSVVLSDKMLSADHESVFERGAT